MSTYIVKTSRTTYWLLENYWNLAKSHHRVDQEPDHCTLHDCGAFFVVVRFQALFHNFARWHVLELEHESLEHGLHCPRAYRNFMSVRVVAWAQNKGTHDAEVHPCRAQHLSQSSSLATNQSLFAVPDQPRKFWVAYHTCDRHPHFVTFSRTPSVAQIIEFHLAPFEKLTRMEITCSSVCTRHIGNYNIDISPWT